MPNDLFYSVIKKENGSEVTKTHKVLFSNTTSTLYLLEDESGKWIRKLIRHNESLISAEAFHNSILREYLSLQKLSLLSNQTKLMKKDHKFSFLSPDEYAFDMKYFEGKSLDNFSDLSNNKTDIIKLFISILNKVQEIHTAGILHNDLKPENIILNYSDNGDYTNLHVIDFGSAVIINNDFQKFDGTPGTKGFMAPEVARFGQQMGKIHYDNNEDIRPLIEDAIDYLSDLINKKYNNEEITEFLENYLNENFDNNYNEFMKLYIKDNPDYKIIDDSKIRYAIKDYFKKAFIPSKKQGKPIIETIPFEDESSFLANSSFLHSLLSSENKINRSNQFSLDSFGFSSSILSSNKNNKLHNSTSTVNDNEDPPPPPPLSCFSSFFADTSQHDEKQNATINLSELSDEEIQELSKKSSIQQDGKFSILSTKSDIYSIGKIFKYLLDINNYNYEEFGEIIENMTSINSSERPSIEEIINKLLKINIIANPKMSKILKNPNSSSQQDNLDICDEQNDASKLLDESKKNNKNKKNV